MQELSDEFDVTAGQTTSDGLLRLATAPCQGLCELAPVVLLDSAVQGGGLPQAVTNRLRELLARGTADKSQP